MFQQPESVESALVRLDRVRAPVPGMHIAACLVSGSSRLSVTEARGWLRKQCDRAHVPCDASADLLVVLSELVTNSLVHTVSTSVALGFACLMPITHVSVTDEGPPGLFSLATDRASEIAGHGLTIVNSLAHRWGWERADEGSRVWAEVLGSAQST